MTWPSWVGPEGTLELFDLQRSSSTTSWPRPPSAGSPTWSPTQGDATDLPFADASVDAVVLTAVLGEIPDGPAALREIRRVLRPGGRLVVGELFGDPHFTTAASLERLGRDAGLTMGEHSGNWFGYFARLEPGAPA